jgi:hypothetical protein
MARRRIKNLQKEFAARELDYQIETDKNLSSSITMEGLKIEIDKINTLLKNDNIESIEPADLVSLYAWCHEQLYDIIPEELISKQWSRARKAAEVLVEESLGSNVAWAVRYFRWVWDRERGMMNWKMDRGYIIKRINWWAMFVDKKLLMDFKTAEVLYAKKNNKL